MIATAPQVRPGRMPRPDLGDRELEQAKCELVDLFDRYCGRSMRLKRKANFWRLVRYCGRPIAEIATSFELDESTIRQHIEEVDRALRCLHGRPSGHPVEQFLSYP
jgi:hypothetical protein